MLSTMLHTWPSFSRPVWGDSPFQFLSACDSSQQLGNFVSHQFESDLGSLRYKLFIPTSYADAPLPLIIMLHGGGQGADDFALGTRMNEVAEQYSCLVAYPEQSPNANWNRCWNWFDEAHHQRGQGEAALIAGVTRKVLAEYEIDHARIYAAGMSSGGAMAVILGRTYPELFSAVGCHSGLAHGSATDHFGAVLTMRDGPDLLALRRTEAFVSVPTIVFHGDLDFTVHPKNSIGVVQQSLECYIARVGHTNAQIAMSEEAGETAGRRFTRIVHRTITGNTLAEQWIVHGTGHAWSGGCGRGSYTDSGGPEASEEMLRFFLQHRRGE